MGIAELIILSIGLAMDAFAVSICKGISMKKMDWKKAIIIGLWFGAFQAIMPLIGYLLGSTFEQIVKKVDHWFAFILLSAIGANMIKESFSEDTEDENDDIRLPGKPVDTISKKLNRFCSIILRKPCSLSSFCLSICFKSASHNLASS